MENFNFCVVLPPEVFDRKDILKIPQNSQENTCTGVFFSINLQAACKFIKKETPVRLFYCEFCENFKNIFFVEHLRTAASYYSAKGSF